MYKDDDIGLVTALSQGNMRAFEQLFEKYHGPLYYHILGFAKSERLAEDAVQDVFKKDQQPYVNSKAEV